MSYDAKIFNVMIASPGDVAAERTIVRDVIYEWNAVNSNSKQIVLLPIGWESHASPEMGAHPQEIINSQILGKCDLIIGIFWTRIGTPTTEYKSGTVEEIEKHIANNKPAMLYFSSQPVAIETVDLEQIKKLSEFKESCRSRGLNESYDSHRDFKEKFYRHLQLKVNEHVLFSVKKITTEVEIIESKFPFPEISHEGKTILSEASKDDQGSILLIRHLQGTTMQVNGRDLIASDNRREISKWESALEELLTNGLVIERGHRGEVFEITNLGYQTAEMINLQ